MDEAVCPSVPRHRRKLRSLHKTKQTSLLVPHCCRMLLLFLLTAAASGRAAPSSRLYQAREDTDVIFDLRGHAHADTPLLSVLCVFLSEPARIFYLMVDGVEMASSSHWQFAGRVQVNGEALRGGRVTLTLTSVRTNDSGSFLCDLAVGQQWASADFVLDVTAAAEPPAAEGAEGAPPAGFVALVACGGFLLVTVVLQMYDILRQLRAL